MKTVARALLDYLKREGVSCIFGIPGGPITPLFDVLHDESEIRLIATRHEEGAAFMAAGYARVSGRLGACCATTGPGTTNLATGLAAAHADGLPVLAITAQVASSTFGKGSLQDSLTSRLDTVAMMKAVSKASALLTNSKSMEAVVGHLLRACLSGRRGPVHLSIPSDVMKQETTESAAKNFYRADARPVDLEAAGRALGLLLGARRPAILAGHGVNLAGAHSELLELAERLGIPVATTPRGKSAFPESHPLSLRVFGLAGSPLAERYLLGGEVDILMVLGSTLHEISTLGWDQRLIPKETIIQADIDPEAIGRNYPVGVGVVGDLKAILGQMLKQLGSGFQHSFAPPALFPELKFRPPTPPSARGALKPQDLFLELSRHLPEDAVIFVDNGNAALWAVHYLTIDRPNSFIDNWGDFGAMGYATAAVIGGKLAAPARPMISIVGDGAFAMMGMEVLTAVTYDIPVIWIVLNDGRFNTVHHGMRLQYEGRTTGTEFAMMDVAKVAEGLGALGLIVDQASQVEEALRVAAGSGRPAVIDVRIDPDEAPPIESRVKSLKTSFAAA